MYNWGVEEELLETNPIAGLRKRGKEAAATRTLSEAELRVLWRALETTDDMSVDVAMLGASRHRTASWRDRRGGSAKRVDLR